MSDVEMATAASAPPPHVKTEEELEALEDASNLQLFYLTMEEYNVSLQRDDSESFCTACDQLGAYINSDGALDDDARIPYILKALRYALSTLENSLDIDDIRLVRMEKLMAIVKFHQAAFDRTVPVSTADTSHPEHIHALKKVQRMIKWISQRRALLARGQPRPYTKHGNDGGEASAVSSMIGSIPPVTPLTATASLQSQPMAVDEPVVPAQAMSIDLPSGAAAQTPEPQVAGPSKSKSNTAPIKTAKKHSLNPEPRKASSKSSSTMPPVKTAPKNPAPAARNASNSSSNAQPTKQSNKRAAVEEPSSSEEEPLHKRRPSESHSSPRVPRKPSGADGPPARKRVHSNGNPNPSSSALPLTVIVDPQGQGRQQFEVKLPVDQFLVKIGEVEGKVHSLADARAFGQFLVARRELRQYQVEQTRQEMVLSIEYEANFRPWLVVRHADAKQAELYGLVRMLRDRLEGKPSLYETFRAEYPLPKIITAERKIENGNETDVVEACQKLKIALDVAPWGPWQNSDNESDEAFIWPALNRCLQKLAKRAGELGHCLDQVEITLGHIVDLCFGKEGVYAKSKAAVAIASLADNVHAKIEEMHKKYGASSTKPRPKVNLPSPPKVKTHSKPPPPPVSPSRPSPRPTLGGSPLVADGSTRAALKPESPTSSLSTTDPRPRPRQTPTSGPTQHIAPSAAASAMPAKLPPATPSLPPPIPRSKTVPPSDTDMAVDAPVSSTSTLAQRNISAPPTSDPPRAPSRQLSIAAPAVLSHDRMRESPAPMNDTKTIATKLSSESMQLDEHTPATTPDRKSRDFSVRHGSSPTEDLDYARSTRSESTFTSSEIDRNQPRLPSRGPSGPSALRRSIGAESAQARASSTPEIRPSKLFEKFNQVYPIVVQNVLRAPVLSEKPFYDDLWHQGENLTKHDFVIREETRHRLRTYARKPDAHHPTYGIFVDVFDVSVRPAAGGGKYSWPRSGIMVFVNGGKIEPSFTDVTQDRPICDEFREITGLLDNSDMQVFKCLSSKSSPVPPDLHMTIRLYTIFTRQWIDGFVETTGDANTIARDLLSQRKGAFEREGAKGSVSLVDPKSSNRIQRPARGLDCQHLECFDLDVFLDLMEETGGMDWTCPVCTQPLEAEALRICPWTAKELVRLDASIMNVDVTDPALSTV